MAVLDKIQFLTMISAGILFIVSLIATELYWKAYCQMKKTRIIGSLALLLLSISIKFLFVIVAFMLVWIESLDLTAFNAMNFVPNLLMILALMYSYIFTILQLQDYSLLLGSIGLFLTLAVIMHFSKKIQW